VVFILAVKKFPAFPTLMIGALVGGFFAVIFQPEVVRNFANSSELNSGVQLFKGTWTALFDGFKIETGDASMDKLLNRGGMSSMLNTIWLIMCAITFGSILEKLGMLKRLVQGMLSIATSTGSLILVTALTCFGINVFASDQYISIVLPGRMFRIEYKNRNLDPRNLSRALEDTGTVTSVLIPWNTCGVFMASTLLVPTMDFALFCFFNILSPIISVLYGFFNITIIPLEEKTSEEASA
jgi:NhaC family Na+:H+ antiporter